MYSERRDSSAELVGEEKTIKTRTVACHERILVGLVGSTSDPALKLESVETV